MKAVRWYAPRDLRLVDETRPEPQPHEALVRVESVGICGSDMHYYEEGCIGLARLCEPLILGHEYGGIVEAVGRDADPSLIGKRVAVEPGIPCLRCEWCRRGQYNVCLDMSFPGGPGFDGALREYVPVHADFCFPVPDTIDGMAAAMIEPLAVAVHTVELANVRPGDTAMVLGLGPIGLLTARVAKLAGVQTIYGSDLLDYRVEAGLRHGVDVAFNAGKEDTVARVMNETNGRGVDIAFDCARSSDTLGLSCRVTRPGGRCILTGISGAEEDPIPVSICRRRELTLQWCRRFKHNYPAAIALVASGKIDVRSMCTHSFPIEKTPEAFALVSRMDDGVLKASVDF